MGIWTIIWTCISGGATAAVAVAAYLYLLVSLYPRLTLRWVWKGDPLLGDRGLRRVTFPGGRAVVYAPAPGIRRYIPTYALIKEAEGVFIRCRIHESIAYIRYDVATFDAKGKLLDVLRVSERITACGCTHGVRLPRNTAYATLVLRRVDGEYVGRDATVGYGIRGMGIYVALSAVTAAIVGYILHGSIFGILDAVWRGPWEIRSLGATLVASVLLGILGAAGVLLMHELHRKQVINK